ncbi:MAG TPA: hypothetical protein VKR52_20630 [Terracidiphilus sp.]|nr:hypothetical protein [Terracidiphilus sp.]
MAVSTIDNLDLDTLLSISNPAVYRGPLMAAPEMNSAAASHEERELASRREGLNWTRGLLVGILLEIGMGIILYGLWQGVWHLMHLHR